MPNLSKPMKLDDVKKLQQKKYRERFGHFLVEGEHLLLELFQAIALRPELQQAQLFLTEEYAAWLAEHNTIGLPYSVIGDKAMKQISGTLSPQGIVAVVPLLKPNLAPAPQAVYLHEIQDPGNLGTIIRTLGWFGGFQLFLSENSVDPYNPKVVRSSMGAIFHVPFKLEAKLSDVQKHYPRLAYLDMAGTDITHSSFQQFDGYVFGNEARGVPHDLLLASQATPFTIPGSGMIESLNLASAVNMSVYELKRGVPR